MRTGVRYSKWPRRTTWAALKTKNEKAHAGITDNLMENRRQIHENRRQIQQVAESMRSIDRSVAFLSGPVARTRPV